MSNGDQKNKDSFLGCSTFGLPHRTTPLLKKLSLPQSPQKFIIRQIEQSNFTVLPIQMKQALTVYSLPNHHEDPFDRLLIAQSLSEKIPLITGDKLFKKYRLSTVW